MADAAEGTLRCPERPLLGAALLGEMERVDHLLRERQPLILVRPAGRVGVIRVHDGDYLQGG